MDGWRLLTVGMWAMGMTWKCLPTIVRQDAGRCGRHARIVKETSKGCWLEVPGSAYLAASDKPQVTDADALMIIPPCPQKVTWMNVESHKLTLLT